jgi:predicted nuclease of predicted toxin-antitoxin system
VRVDDLLPRTSIDATIIATAVREDRILVTQDLDLSALIALAGKIRPSLVSLRLSSSRIEHVNDVLERVLREMARDLERGAIVMVEDQRVRRRSLPIG